MRIDQDCLSYLNSSVVQETALRGTIVMRTGIDEMRATKGMEPRRSDGGKVLCAVCLGRAYYLDTREGRNVTGARR